MEQLKELLQRLHRNGEGIMMKVAGAPAALGGPLGYIIDRVKFRDDENGGVYDTLEWVGTGDTVEEAVKSALENVK